jgi:hypothetical protein
MASTLKWNEYAFQGGTSVCDKTTNSCVDNGFIAKFIYDNESKGFPKDSMGSQAYQKYKII